MQFEKDVRMLVNQLSTATQWTVRDKFTRLGQMASLLNLEAVGEVADYWSGSLISHLNAAEVRRVLRCRQEFSTQDIDRLRL